MVVNMSMVQLCDTVEQSETCQFYKDKTLFITGVTGFCGKVMLEKIARVLLPVKRVYVLIRSKNGQTAQERLEELVQSQAFSFHDYSSNQLTKLVAMEGDCSLPDVGLSEINKQLLINEVDIVFHSAASVRFDAIFAYNFKQNTLGIKNMVDLIKKFIHIDHFVHVSTAFVQCQVKKLEDEIKDFVDDIDVIIDKVCAAQSDEEKELIAQPYYDGRPNSYILTKALAESYVKKHCQTVFTLPVTDQTQYSKIFKTYVVRPSVVFNAKKEPTIGWIDTYNGPSGFAIFMFLGLILYPKVDTDKTFHIVPVDYLANMLISIPYLYTLKQENEVETQPKLEIITVTYDDVTADVVMKRGFKIFEKYPSLYCIRVPELLPVKQPKDTWYMRSKRYVFEYLWAHFMDFWLMIFGLKKKISIVRLYHKYQRAIKMMEHFVTHDFDLPTVNYKRLVKLQNASDSVLFDFDLNNYGCESIAISYVLGTRRYLLKEPDSTIKLASTKFKIRRHLFSLKFLICLIIFIVLLCLIF